MYSLKDSKKNKFLKEKEKSPYPWQGENTIVDEKEFDGDLKLHKGKYVMLSSSFDVMIKKEGIQLETYDHLRNFRHANAIPLLDYYTQKGKFGCLIVPKIHSSFQSWFEREGKSLLFDDMGHMTPIFEKMIIEYCDLIESLLGLKLILEDFDIRNIYVNIFDGVPTLCVLLTKVKKVEPVGVLHRKLTWDCARKFMSWCEDQCDIRRDDLTEKFCAFLVKLSCSVAKLKRYPHNWDDSVKGEYLMALVGSEHKRMRSLLEGSGLSWPFRAGLPRRADSLPELLQDILSWDELERHKNHNIQDFFSYVILVRNCYKHLDGLPNEIKNVLTSRKVLISHIEIWTPDFWIKVYEIIGWP